MTIPLRTIPVCGPFILLFRGGLAAEPTDPVSLVEPLHRHGAGRDAVGHSILADVSRVACRWA